MGNGRISRGRCNYFIRSGKRMELDLLVRQTGGSSEGWTRGITQGSYPSSSPPECAEKGKAMTIFAFLKVQSDTWVEITGS